MTTQEIEGIISTMKLGECREIEGVSINYVPAAGRYGKALKDHYSVQMGAGTTWCYSPGRAAKTVVMLRNAYRKERIRRGEGD